MTKEEEKKYKYSEIVASIYDEKLYFQDAINWYCLKYLNAISERTFYIVLSIMSFFICILLYLTIDSIQPLKEQFPVLIMQKDSVNYFSTITPLKPENITYNSNEAILRFLLLNYVRNLFDHDYKRGNIEDLNTKLTKIKLYSTDELYQRYRTDFNQISSKMFNKKVDQKILINSFKFVKKQEKDKKKKLLNYLFSKMPTEAEMSYKIIFTNYGIKQQKISTGKIILDFKYESISYNNLKKEFTKPILIVTDYEIIDTTKVPKNDDEDININKNSSNNAVEENKDNNKIAIDNKTENTKLKNNNTENSSTESNKKEVK